MGSEFHPLLYYAVEAYLILYHFFVLVYRSFAPRSVYINKSPTALHELHVSLAEQFGH